MAALIKNEIIKLFSKKKTYITLIAFVLLTFVISYGTYREKQNQKKYNSPQNMIEQNEQRINNMSKNIDDSSLSKSDKESMQLDIEKLKAENENLKNESNGKNNLGWKKSLQDKNEELKKSKEQMMDKTKVKYAEKGSIDNIAEIDNQIKTNNYLIDNNIKPKSDYDFNAYSCINDIIDILGAIFIAVGVAIFSSDIVSGEFIPPTMKVLLIQPVSRGKVLFSKYITTLIASLVLIIGVEMLAFLIIGGIFGFGSNAYPNIIGLKYQFDKTNMINGSYNLKLVAGSGIIISQGKFLLYSILLQALFITVVFSFTFLLSVIFKSSMVSVGLNVVIVIFISIFQSFPVINKITSYLFFTYGSTSNVLKGDLMRQMNNPNITINFAIAVMAIWTVVCYMLSHIIFKKRDILI